MGINCSTGPEDMVWMIREMLRYAEAPLIAQPNAGLPDIVGGRAIYDIEPRDFAEKMQEIAEMGVYILGGCCGTTPEFISEMAKVLKDSL
jgi:5-methyltetrahydrofolate--homocysteine methyltransferase